MVSAIQIFIDRVIRRHGPDTTYFVSSSFYAWVSLTDAGPLLCLSDDTDACFIPFLCIASCLPSLALALLQFRHGFTTMMRLGSRQLVDVNCDVNRVLTFAFPERDRCLL